MGRRGKVYKGSGNGEESRRLCGEWSLLGKGSGKDMPPPNIYCSQTIVNLRWIFTATAAIPCGQKVY